MKKAIIIMGILVLLLIGSIIQYKIVVKSKVNEVCEKIGFNTTNKYYNDFYENAWGNRRHTVKIKCGEDFQQDCWFIKDCVKKNDFEVCLKKRYQLYCDDGTESSHMNLINDLYVNMQYPKMHWYDFI